MLLTRQLGPTLTKRAEEYPIVTLIGPRHSGKTTLARTTFAGRPYYNLEAPDTREKILQDPRSFLGALPHGAILDEIQRAPDLLSYLQVIVDEHEVSGEFILTGSHQLQLHSAISQSLAGRTSLLTLFPLSLRELTNHEINPSADEAMLRGGYPILHRKDLSPTTVYRDYLKTYVERDVRLLLNIKDLASFQRFIQLAAGRLGSVLNIESLANDAGVVHNTVKNWLSITEASFLTFRLMPYFENFGKRIIKAPKLYFADVGLVSYLLDIETTKQMAHDRLRGSLFENLVVLELLKARANQGKDLKIFYYRDSNRNEVDVVIAHRHYLIPVEIKSSATFNRSMVKNIEYFRNLAADRVLKGFLVYTGEEESDTPDLEVLNFRHADRIIDYIDTLP